MKRLSDALFSPYHSFLAILIAWLGMVGMAADALGFWQPDYQRMIVVAILAYWSTVVCDLRRSRPKRRSM